MKFLVPNYSCLQNPWLRGYRLQIPVFSVLCHQLNLLNPPKIIPGYATALKGLWFDWYFFMFPAHLLISCTSKNIQFPNQQEERLALLNGHICLHKIQWTVRSVGNVGSCASKQNDSKLFFINIYTATKLLIYRE